MKWVTALLTAIGIFLSAILVLTVMNIKTTLETSVALQALRSDMNHLQRMTTEVKDLQAGFILRSEYVKDQLSNDKDHRSILDSLRNLTEKLDKIEKQRTP